MSDNSDLSQPAGTTSVAADVRPSNWNLPNILTVLRIIGVPVFLWLLLIDAGQQPYWRWWGFGVFAVLMATDKLDGYLARSRNMVTDFGKIADPIADKSLMIAALAGLNFINVLPWWVTIVIVCRELGITVWRMVLLRRGLIVPASKGGKLKTVLQSFAVAMFLAPIPGSIWHVASWIAMGLAVVVTVATGVQYLLDSRSHNS